MPDRWLTAGLNLNALTPFKAFALITTALAMAFLSSAAIAETTGERQACMGDAFRVCWSAIPDRNAVFHCLMDNRPRLSGLSRRHGSISATAQNHAVPQRTGRVNLSPLIPRRRLIAGPARAIAVQSSMCCEFQLENYFSLAGNRI